MSTEREQYHAVVVVLRGDDVRAWESAAESLKTNPDVLFVGEAWEVTPLNERDGVNEPEFTTEQAAQAFLDALPPLETWQR